MGYVEKIDGAEVFGESLPNIIYEKLRLDILDGVLRPGQLLRQEELSKRFNSSRVPLREAMTRLVSDGLIILRPRRGYAVSALQRSEILEIFELRAVVEEHAGMLAARARTRDDIERVELSLINMEKLKPDAANYMQKWLRGNYQFHANLIASSRREYVARYAAMLRDTVEPYIRVEMQMTGDVREAEQDHREIFDAFSCGDAVRLATLSREHVENTAQRLLEGLRRLETANASRAGKERRRQTKK
jgi:DNA-binding GntR family transcriptional regulator